MNRRVLTTMMLGFLAVLFAAALPQSGFAQSNPLVGTWKLNLAKSKFSPGPPPRSQSVNYEAVGQGLRVTADVIDAEGNSTKVVFGPYSFDGKSYPITGAPAFDAATYKQVNNSTYESTRTKAGKAVQTTTNVLSADSKTRTLTTTGVNEKGEQINSVAIYDKQ
jgi:hypothetical protein